MNHYPSTKDHYLTFSEYTFPGLYHDYLKNSLPDSLQELALLIRKNFIHRATLRNGNTLSNCDLRYGDMAKVPWWRQCEDDILPTAGAILIETFRRDPRGLIHDKAEESRLVLTCRFIALLTVSILKAKGIPARVRAGFEAYWHSNTKTRNDHWVAEYWDIQEGRWVLMDVDCFLEDAGFNTLNVPADKFFLSPQAWILARRDKQEAEGFVNAGGFKGLMVTAWELLYDFHCLMNHEVSYLHVPKHLRIGKFDEITDEEINELDALAALLCEPDKNFSELSATWNTNQRLRLLSGGLL